MGCDIFLDSRLFNSKYFNPRTRMGCDHQRLKSRQNQATFQSTHPHGVRRDKRFQIIVLSRHFNPRTRMGCDHKSRARPRPKQQFQSTHPHGVRLGNIRTRCLHLYFNPRTRMGCDTSKPVSAKRPPYFNPRTRMGCDFAASRSFIGKRRFQSTHPHGVRQRKILDQILDDGISIHAPAWGAT